MLLERGVLYRMAAPRMYNLHMASWQEDIRSELAAAIRAREAGNEGRARVCARRAAGIAAREYLLLQGEQTNGSGYDLLLRLQGRSELAASSLKAAEQLTWRVGEDFSLPEGVDLIAQAQHLCLTLCPDLSL